MTITTNQLSYNAKTKTFSAELSDLDSSVGYLSNLVIIKNPKTGKSKPFQLHKTDTDGEDIFGYRFKYDDLTLLLIND